MATDYLHVVEIESAMTALAMHYPTICELVTLPNPSFEGKTIHFVRIGSQPASQVDGLYLTGGVHARELGSSDILVNFAADICEAYTLGSNLIYGNKIFSPLEVKVLVEQMNIFVFPCTNPDGRQFVQDNSNTLWRRNRNTTDSGGDPAKIGVDINRNQDFLWDYKTFFDPSVMDPSLASDKPIQETYHGSSAGSEKESKNIVWIFDTYPRIKYYIDLHSYSQDIIYVWGDDESQTNDTSLNYQNTAYDGKRGVLGDTYREYLDDYDESRLMGLGSSFTQSLFQVRGTSYVSKSSFSLYPTCGTNADYAYSRHISDSSKTKILAFTIEWGQTFIPLYPEMVEIIKDVSSGLMGFGLEILGIASFIVTDRDTFSSYEVETIPAFPAAFYVVYDGIPPATLGVPGSTPAFRFFDAANSAAIPSISAGVTNTLLENPGAPSDPQRIMFTCQVNFTDGSSFTSETRNIWLQADFGGMTCLAAIKLIRQPNPYMSDGSISWLSTDLRVFQLRKNEKLNGSNQSLEDPDMVPDAPYHYIQGLLTELRGNMNNPAPGFENISQDEETSQLELSRTVDGDRVLNFAVAKVRYRSSSTDATDVRVFFRTFNTMISDLSYTPNIGANLQNYRRSTNGLVALLGVNHFFTGNNAGQIVSIPYFAQKRQDTMFQSMNDQVDNFNKLTLHGAGATEALAYFGCWLDFNQTDPQFPTRLAPIQEGPYSNRVSIMQMVRGIHQCMVAEIRFQPGSTDPIPNGATPGSSDRLAQRNLTIVYSDNPGVASTHLVQHTLLVKPSVRLFHDDLKKNPITARWQYDELVFMWHGLPSGTTAYLYFPEWSADEVLKLSSLLGRMENSLTKVDENTVSFIVHQANYIPIPRQTERPHAGLFSIQLPLTVKDGERYTVDVQQHSGPLLINAVQTVKEHQVRRLNLSKRKILGSFRMTIPVRTAVQIVPRTIRQLAVLKYIALGIPATDVWHPVFERYIRQMGDSLTGFGIDPDSIKPSPDDPGHKGQGGCIPDSANCITGRVQEIIYDCLGLFRGFTIVDCGKCFSFACDEKRIENLLLRVMKADLLLTVCTNAHDRRKINRLSVSSTQINKNC